MARKNRRNLCFALFLYVIFPMLCLAQKQTAYNEAQTFLKEKDYFRARDFYRASVGAMSPQEKLVIESYLAHAFNRPGKSNSAITAFLDRYGKETGDSLKLALLQLKLLNHVRLFEYANAFKVNGEIFVGHGKLLSAADSADYSNMAVIWKALATSPKQLINVRTNTVIRMKRDKAKLANLEIKANGSVSDFIFDTGANFSTVSETTAKKLGMKGLDGRLEVAAITGANVNSRLALCPEFSFGNIIVRNAVFLVFPDSALAFPQINYQINGIIGFPVIEGLKEVQLTRNDEFVVPKVRSKENLQNMALDFLTPILDLEGACFTFDTGASGTMLYSKYLRKHFKDIVVKYAQTELQFGGAGGVLKKKGYKIAYSPVINGRRLKIDNVHLFGESLVQEKDYFYGNIGQDVIKQFGRLTINFSSMFIRLE
jgi:predicted aspartyl protease